MNGKVTYFINALTVRKKRKFPVFRQCRRRTSPVNFFRDEVNMNKLKITSELEINFLCYFLETVN